MNFRKMLAEAILNESPYMTDYEPKEITDLAMTALKSAVQNQVSHKKAGEHNIITSSTGLQAHFHKSNGVPPRSISIFTPNTTHGGVIHSYTSKRDGNADEIIQNMKVARQEHKKVWSDTDQTPGAVKLWRKLSSKHPRRVHVMKLDGSTGKYASKGLLAELPDQEVWGKTKDHLNTRLLFK